MNILNYCHPFQNKHVIFLGHYNVNVIPLKQSRAKKGPKHIIYLLHPSPGPDSGVISHSPHPQSTGASLTLPGRPSQPRPRSRHCLTATPPHAVKSRALGLSPHAADGVLMGRGSACPLFACVKATMTSVLMPFFFFFFPASDHLYASRIPA